MEANDFFSGYEALQDASRTIQLTLCDPCPINKIVWSSFDHITGPELRFVWEIIATTNLTPVALSTNSESTKDGSVSTTSSVSQYTNSGAYEEIDDILQIAETERPQYLDEFMMESRSTLGGTVTAADDDEDLSRLMTSFASSSQFTEEESQSESASRLEVGLDFESLFKHKGVKAASSSPARLQSRTGGSVSNLYKNSETEEVRYGLDPLTAKKECARLASLSLSSASDGTGEGSKVSASGPISNATLLNNAEFVSSSAKTDSFYDPAVAVTLGDRTFVPDDAKTEEVSQALITSTVDSGIAGTISAHSDLSVFCTSLCSENQLLQSHYDPEVGLLTNDLLTYCGKVDEGYIEGNRFRDASPLVLNESVDYDTLMEMSGESTSVQPTDDEFIAKLVLTDQVYSLQLPSSCLMHKINIIPKRRLLIGSYLFPVTRLEDGKNVTCAISVVTADTSYEWYMKRQSVIEEMFLDVTPRLKASYFSEAMEDVICRMRTEFERMLLVLGAAERHTICPAMEEMKIHHTHLFDPKLIENAFLAKAVTGLLRSQSHCIIVGDQHKSVSKILNTLSFFIPEEWQWCSLKSYKHAYSPYLRLLAINRTELPTVVSAGVESHWPVTIIDVDKQLVCISSSYLKHRRMKQLRQRNDVAAILLSAGLDIDVGDARQNKLELRNCHTSSSVTEFFAKMDLLPYERTARIGFIRQFLLSIENRARAFITYIQDVSTPNATDKSNAVSSRWSLNAARKALDLTSESSFSIVLAEAERLKTGIADFICDTRSS